MSTSLRPVLILPLLKGKTTLKNYKLFAGEHWQAPGLFRVMLGEAWLDPGRTLSECLALVSKAAADALGVPVDAPPDWPVGTPVRVMIPGPMNVRKLGGRSESVTADAALRMTRTRTMCEPFTRRGIHYVRVVGYSGEVPCSQVELIENPGALAGALGE